MNAVFSIAYYLKDKMLEKEWKLEAVLNRHSVITAFNKQMNLFETTIYALDERKGILSERNIRYIAMDKEGATRWHYRAVTLAVEIEKGKINIEI